VNKKGYHAFCEDLETVPQYFPNLQILEKGGFKILKGILDIPDDKGRIVGHFLVEVHFAKHYPFEFPLLYEVGGEIEAIADWHKNSDESCCITVKPDEIIKCQKGIKVVTFIKEHAIPYFANQIHRKITGEYKNGYFGHGMQGYRQFYAELFQSSDVGQWKLAYLNCFYEVSMPMKKKCFCNSGKVFGCCHAPIFDQMKIIGQEHIRFFLTAINK
jgi:hypothetical protein